MGLYFSTPRPKVELYQVNPLFILVLTVCTLALQSFLPLHINFVRLLDLPLLVVIYFGLTRRNPIKGIFVGSFIGLAQDALSRGPLGMAGMVKTVIGFVTTLFSVRFDADDRVFRFCMSFVCYWLNYVLLFFMSFLLLRFPIPFEGLARLAASLVNSAVGVLLFSLLDRFRKRA
jgi:rod shape-determining protein MreD